MELSNDCNYHTMLSESSLKVVIPTAAVTTSPPQPHYIRPPTAAVTTSNLPLPPHPTSHCRHIPTTSDLPLPVSPQPHHIRPPTAATSPPHPIILRSCLTNKTSTLHPERLKYRHIYIHKMDEGNNNEKRNQVWHYGHE